MPRIYDSGSDPHDFCKRCFPPTEQQAERIFANTNKFGIGPDGRGNCFAYDAEHPPYEHENYDCEVCHKHLSAKDN